MEKEYILCAAIWFDDKKQHTHQPKNIETGYVICGRRHHNCFITAHILTGDTSYVKYEKEQGFITNLDRFVDRVEGRKIAFEAGQLAGRDVSSRDKLFSEDLY